MRLCILAFCLSSFGIIADSFGQDSHYWTQQFGARASLLGGSVIAGLDDNSAVYYNPANLAFVDYKSLSINTNAYRYQVLNMTNGAGQGLDLKSKRVSLYPQMVSGLLFNKKPERPWRLAFAILTRQSANIDASLRHEDYYEIINDNPGKEFYTGSVEFQNILNETWFGLGSGYRLAKFCSVGMTFFTSYRNQKYRTSVFTRTSYASDSLGGKPFLAEYSYYDNIRLNNIKVLFKGSVHFRFGGWRIGLVATAPAISVWGESRAEREQSYINLIGNQDAIKSDQQRRLKTHYKTPLTLGLGIMYRQPKYLISLSAEYFGRIRPYKMISAEAREVFFPSNLNQGAEDFLSFYNFSDAIANFAIGYEHQVHELFTVHAGFRTDFTYRRFQPEGNRLIFLSPNLDLYHCSAGASWKRRASALSLGLNYTFGFQNNITQFINLTEPSRATFLQGTPQRTSNITNQMFTILIGYTYYFALQ